MNQRRIIDPAKTRAVEELLKPESKPLELSTTDISIDDLLNRGLRAIYGVMRAIESDVGTGMPSRETIMNLRDIFAMLKELKKDEKDLLDNMSDEELNKLASIK